MFEETHTLQLSWVHTVRFIIGLQILISLTTVVQPGYCHLKSKVTALNWCWCCHVVFWSDAPPSTYLPITKCVPVSGLPALLQLQMYRIKTCWILLHIWQPRVRGEEEGIHNSTVIWKWLQY